VLQGNYFGIDPARSRERAEDLLEFALLADRGDERVYALSGGMKRRLLISRALVNEPDLVVMDEPTTGLDPQARRLVWERVRSLKRRGTTILLTTHYMEEAAQLCDRLVIMDHGRIIVEGAPADLVARHVGSEVVEVYLGGVAAADAPALARLGHGPWRSERVGEVLYLYLRDGEAGPAMFSALDGLDFARRRATLEDVFLTLTGHALRD
jgi:lipooligosaccharide transport system ATP-binding protein